MMQLKSGVKARGITTELLLGIMVAKEVFNDAGQSFTITSLNDSQHSENSLHYEGNAVDIRTRDLTGVTATDMAARIKLRLGAQYDVVVEPTHIHLEFDPK